MSRTRRVRGPGICRSGYEAAVQAGFDRDLIRGPHRGVFRIGCGRKSQGEQYVGLPEKICSGFDRRLHAVLEPEFNPAITASGIFDPSVTEEIGELLGDGLPFGDADALADLAGRVAGLLGLDIRSRPDPGNLDPDVGRAQGRLQHRGRGPGRGSAHSGVTSDEGGSHDAHPAASLTDVLSRSMIRRASLLPWCPCSG